MNGKRPKIVFLTRSPAYGGAEFHLLQLLRWLDPSAVDARIVCFAEDPYSCRLGSSPPVHAQVSKETMPRTFLDFCRFFGRLRPDVIVFVNGFHGLFPWRAYLAARVDFGRRVFAIEHLMPEVLPPRKRAKGVLGLARRLIGWRARNDYKERIGSYLTDRIICVSNAVRTRLVDEYFHASDRLITVYNGVEITLYQRPHRENGAGKSPAPPTLLCVARLEHEKGVDNLLRALEILSSRAVSCTCTIVGSGRLERELRETCARTGLASTVKFNGFAEDVRPFLETSDIFVLPSRNEGLPYALLEAMASGLPCVATDVGGISDAISHGMNGMVVPPESPEALADAISELLNDPDKRSKMGELARATVASNFNGVESAKQLCALLTS